MRISAVLMTLGNHIYNYNRQLCDKNLPPYSSERSENTQSLSDPSYHGLWSEHFWATSRRASSLHSTTPYAPSLHQHGLPVSMSTTPLLLIHAWRSLEASLACHIALSGKNYLLGSLWSTPEIIPSRFYSTLWWTPA